MQLAHATAPGSILYAGCNNIYLFAGSICLVKYFARCIIFYICSTYDANVFVFLHSPQNLLAGMNKFLESLDITFRRDPNNFRPRINKLNSVKVSSLTVESLNCALEKLWLMKC